MERGADIRSRGSFLSRRGELAVLLSLTGLALVLMLLTNSTQAAIARHLEDFILAPFRTVDHSLRQVRVVLTSNRTLEAELTAARLGLARAEEMRLENERLRAMLGFEGREGFSLIGCEVMAEGAGRLGGAVVLLNRGYNQNIREGMALIGREGLVGKVVEVRPNNSHALLLTHPDCAVAARIERSRVAGIVEWQPGSFTSLKLRNISYLADVRMGDRVISSGLGGVFPEGIPVGTVSGIDKDVAGLVLDITLKPATNFRALEEIFALKSDKAGGVEGAASFGAPFSPQPTGSLQDGLSGQALKDKSRSEIPASRPAPPVERSAAHPPETPPTSPPPPAGESGGIVPPDARHTPPSEPPGPEPQERDTSAVRPTWNEADRSSEHDTIWAEPDSVSPRQPDTPSTP